jgi:hypothetical protein
MLEGRPELCAAVAAAYALGESTAVADLLTAEFRSPEGPVER